MNFFEFLKPVNSELIKFAQQFNSLYVGHQIEFNLYSAKPNQTKLAILCLVEKTGQFEGVKQSFYKLKKGDWNLNIYDCGDLVLSDNEKDNKLAIQGVLQQLNAEDFSVIILTTNTKYAYYQYHSFNQSINYLGIDSRVSLSQENDNLSDQNILNHIISEEPQNLLEYSHLGVQSFFTSQEELDLLEELNFEIFTLGELTENIQEAEPSLRKTHAAYLNLDAIAYPGFQSNHNPSPNGFNNREVCAMAKYAGLGLKTKSFLIGNYKNTESPTDSLLIAEMIWYFFDGLNHRTTDFDFNNETEFERFLVQLPEQEIIFFRNKRNNQWWLNLALESGGATQEIPCSEEDYRTAMRGEIPKRWWKNYKKLI